MSSASSSSEFVLYDITSKDNVCWSPNTHRPRTVLAYKKIPYTTHWLSYPDIDKTLRQHGQEDATVVTLPVLRHGDTYIAESWEIAKYLEEKYPEPSVFAGGIEAQNKFREYVQDGLYTIVRNWILYQLPPILDDRGAEYFVRTREAKFGTTLQSLSKPDDEILPAVRGSLTPVFHSLRQSGAYIMGADFSFADSIVLGVLQWIKRADSDKFTKVMALDADGHFAAWYKRCESLMTQMD